MKPGYKTTEFWITLLSVVYSSIVSSGYVPQNYVTVISAIGGIVAALGYTWARTFIKTNAHE